MDIAESLSQIQHLEQKKFRLFGMQTSKIRALESVTRAILLSPDLRLDVDLYKLQISALVVCQAPIQHGVKRRKKSMDSMRAFPISSCSLDKQRVSLVPMASFERRSSMILAKRRSSMVSVHAVNAAQYPATMSNREAKNEIEDMQSWIVTIRKMLNLNEQDDISLSAYDMAWIALLPVCGSPVLVPEFPQCLQWILHNQHPDGSWGEGSLFFKLCCTLASATTLRKWNQGAGQLQKGLEFVQANLEHCCNEQELTDDVVIILCDLLEEAQNFQIGLSYEPSGFQGLRRRKHALLRSLHLDKLYECPVAFLHYLEGLHKVADWRKLIRIQSSNGSIYNSPVLTACAYMHTSDKKCLQYLNNVVGRATSSGFVYTTSRCIERVSLVEWLQHLGIERYFSEEIEDVLSRVFRFWKGNGVGTGSQAHIQDMKDASTVFRLLRLHGYAVTSDVFDQFPLPLDELPTSGFYSLYLASELSFPGELHLEKLRLHTRQLLLREQEATEGIHMEQLIDEIALSLKFPWYSMLPRIDNKKHIGNYNHSRARNAGAILALARTDFKICQSMHQNELQQVVRWCNSCKFFSLKAARYEAVVCYFSAAATLFEPEFSVARMAWSQMCVVSHAIDEFFDTHESVYDLQSFYMAVKRWDQAFTEDMSNDAKILFEGLYNTVNKIVEYGVMAQGRDLTGVLQEHWEKLVSAYLKEAEWRLSNESPSMEEYMEVALASIGLEIIMLTTMLFVGVQVTDDTLKHPDYRKTVHLIGLVGRLLNDAQGYKRECAAGEVNWITVYLRSSPNATIEEARAEIRRAIDHTQKELVEELLSQKAYPRAFKRVFESMVKVLNVFYKDADEFTRDDMQELVKNVLYTET